MNKKTLKRILASAISLCMMTPVACATLSACTTEKPPVDIVEPELTVNGIELDTSNVKKEFEFNEAFTYAGLKVTATMSDGSKQDVKLEDCRISTPNTAQPGTRNVSVVYSGRSASYQITVKPRVMPTISDTVLLTIDKENDSVAYRVEAEEIDMVTPAVKKGEGVTSFVADAPEDAEITGGGKYLTGYGVKYNYFGFTFSAAQEFNDVTVVLRLANSNDTSITNVGNNLKAYLNFAQTEEGEVGEIPLSATIDAGVCQWRDVVVRNVTIPAGTNTLTFEAQSDKVPDIDYIDFYVGMRYISSVVELSEAGTTVMKDLEEFDTEFASTREDWANANPDKIVNGLGLETVTKESEGKTTSKGTSVAALNSGSQLSTTIRVAQDATVRINFIGSSAGAGSYIVKERWEFYIDGVKLVLVENTDINGGNPAAGEYWDWIPVNLGVYNLSGGDHFFLVKNVGGACNIDGLSFDIISMGSYDESGVALNEQVEPHFCKNVCPDCGKCKDDECTDPVCAEKCECPEADEIDITTSNFGEYKAEAETLKDQSGWVLRPDLAAAGQGFTENWANDFGSGVCAKGFGAGTVIKVLVKVEQAGTIMPSMRMSHYDNNNFDWSNTTITFAGQTLTPVPESEFGHREPADWWKWVEVSLGSVNVEPGVYELVMSTNGGMNLDYFKFTVAPGADFKAEVEINANGSFIKEAETLDKAGVVTRPDFAPAIGEGNYAAAGDENASGGQRIYGFGKGTVFTVSVEADEDCTVDIYLTLFSDQGQTFAENFAVKMDNAGLQIANPDATMTPNGEFHKVCIAQGVKLTKGVHVFSLEVLQAHFDFDCITFTTTEYNGQAA